MKDKELLRFSYQDPLSLSSPRSQSAFPLKLSLTLCFATGNEFLALTRLPVNDTDFCRRHLIMNMLYWRYLMQSAQLQLTNISWSTLSPCFPSRVTTLAAHSSKKEGRQCQGNNRRQKKNKKYIFYVETIKPKSNACKKSMLTWRQTGYM